MLTIRSLTAVLLAVGMAASAHAGIVWRGGIDQASQNAVAFTTSPSGKVAGLVWSIDPQQQGWRLNRSTSMLVQPPAPLTGGYAPLRTLPEYGLPSSPGKAAAISVPSRVPIPKSSGSLPVEIIEPVDRSTLNRIGGKVLKALPVVSTVLTIADLLSELEAEYRDGDIYPKTSSPDPNQVIYDPSPVTRQMILDPGFWVGKPIGYTVCLDNDCYRYFPSLVHSGLPRCGSGSYPAPWQLFNGYYYDLNTGSCVFSVVLSAPRSSITLSPTIVAPLTEQQLVDRVAQLPDGKVIQLINSLPADDRVIDVIARELPNDTEDHIVRWPSPVGVTPPSTVTVGEPRVITETLPDGSTKTISETTTATTTGRDVVFHTERTTTTTSPTGETTTTITTSPITNPQDTTSPPPQTEDLECGLPGYPPCKIDETGTPSPPIDDGENIFKQAIPNCLKTDWETCFPELPDINWSFTLPSGCSPIPVPFARFGFTQVDICPWQGMIHDIMSMLWAAAGLFGAIGILSGRRNTEG